MCCSTQACRRHSAVYSWCDMPRTPHGHRCACRNVEAALVQLRAARDASHEVHVALNAAAKATIEMFKVVKPHGTPCGTLCGGCGHLPAGAGGGRCSKPQCEPCFPCCGPCSPGAPIRAGLRQEPPRMPPRLPTAAPCLRPVVSFYPTSPAAGSISALDAVYRPGGVRPGQDADEVGGWAPPPAELAGRKGAWFWRASRSLQTSGCWQGLVTRSPLPPAAWWPSAAWCCRAFATTTLCVPTTCWSAR